MTMSGQVYLQTFSPENAVMQALAAGDRDAFLQVELEQREMAFMPPFLPLWQVLSYRVVTRENGGGYGASLGESSAQCQADEAGT